MSGGSWVCSSDRNQKQDFVPLDGQAVLEKVAAMPVYAWSPKGRNSHIRHYGPTAQDFYSAFGLGDTDLGIGQQDADGVALAAIQGLHRLTVDQRAVITSLQSDVVQQADTLAKLRTQSLGDIAELRAQSITEIAELRAQSRAEITELKRAVEILLARTAPDARLAAAR